MQIWGWLHSHVNPLYVLLADGSIRNDYTVRILNNGATRKFALDVSGLPNAVVHISGIQRDADGKLIVEVGQDQTREIRMQVQVGSALAFQGPPEIEIKATDSATGQATSAHDHFVTATR